MIPAAFVACVAVACLFVARASGEAECLSNMTAQQAMQGPNELVFSGIVVRITLVIAERLTESRAREGVGLAGTDAIAFTRRPCAGPNELGPNIIQDLGVGKPPQ